MVDAVNKEVVRARLMLFISMCALKMTLDYLYLKIGLPIHGFVSAVNYWFGAVSIVLLGVVALLFTPNYSLPSTYGLVFLIAGVLVPQLSYVTLLSRNYTYTCMLVLCFVIIELIISSLKVPKIYMRIKSTRKLLLAIWAVYFCLGVIIVMKRGGPDLRAFDISSIYALRAENSIGRVWGYLYSMFDRAFFVFFAVYFYKKRMDRLLFWTVVLQLLFFLTFGNKDTLFTLTVVFGISFLWRYREQIIIYPGLFASGLLVSGWLWMAKITPLPAAILVDRMSFIPVKIANNFFDFFSQHEKLWFGESLIGRLTGYKNPYPDPLFIHISKIYSKIPGYSNENTGAFSYAFADGGFLMMIVAAILIAAIFLLFDSLKKEHHDVASISLISTALLFVDSPLLTALLTGGIVAQLCLLLIGESEERNPGNCQLG